MRRIIACLAATSALVVRHPPPARVAAARSAPLDAEQEFLTKVSLVEALRGVEIVVPQNTLDYCLNLTWLRPAFVVHGADWSHPDSAQYATREKVREKLAEWNG